MAYIEHKAIRTTTHLSNSAKYIENELKTEAKLITGIDCDIVDVFGDFFLTKQLYDKADTKVIAHHYIQSFKPGEVNKETANKIGVEFINKIAPGFQGIVVTHIDKAHIHNHILINSVNSINGKMYRANKESLNYARDESDKICKNYGLSIIEPGKDRIGIDNATYRLAEKGQSWKVKMINAIDEAIACSSSKKEFISYLQAYGYEIKWQNKNISLKDPGEQKKFIRVSRLAKQFGNQYSKENIEKRLGIISEKYNENMEEQEIGKGRNNVYDRGDEKEESDRNAKNINSNSGGEQNINSINRGNEEESREDNRRTKEDKRRIEKDRYANWKLEQDRIIEANKKLEHIDKCLEKLANKLGKVTSAKAKNEDENKRDFIKVIMLLIVLLIKIKQKQLRRKYIKTKINGIKVDKNLRIGNVNYDELKKFPGDNKYIKVNIDELGKLKNANFKYTGIVRQTDIVIMVKENDLEKLLDLIGRKYSKQYGNTTYKYLKEHCEKLEFRMCDKEVVEKLRNNKEFKFTCFAKDEKFNVVFDNKNLELYKRILADKKKKDIKIDKEKNR